MDVIKQFRSYRRFLWGVSALGLVGVNGVFLYYALVQPGRLIDALQNPVSAAFIVEALLMTALLAWMIWAANIEKPGWGIFIVLSIVGSLAFSVPAFLLLHLRTADGETP